MLPTNFDRRPTIRNKIHKNESKLLKQNVQGGKRFIGICDTIPTLSVYYKGSLNNKNGILYKTNHNFNKFLKNHQSFPYEKGKSLKDMLVRAKKKKVNKGFTESAACHPLHFLAQQVSSIGGTGYPVFLSRNLISVSRNTLTPMTS